MAHMFPSPGQQPDCSPRAARRGHLHETPRVSQRRHLVRSAESLLSPPSSYSPPVIPPPPSPAPAPAPAIVEGAVEAERDLDRRGRKPYLGIWGRRPGAVAIPSGDNHAGQEGNTLFCESCGCVPAGVGARGANAERAGGKVNFFFARGSVLMIA